MLPRTYVFLNACRPPTLARRPPTASAPAAGRRGKAKRRRENARHDRKGSAALVRVFVKPDRCLGCRTCELSCALWRDSAGRRLAGAGREDPPPRSRVRVIVGPAGRAFPNQCRQCADAPCVAVCPTGALSLAEATPARGWARDAGQAGRDPAIQFRAQLCIGCFSCLYHCPFGAVLPDGDGRYPLRCDACAQMEYPACVDSCPAEALALGDEADMDPADGWEPFAVTRCRQIPAKRG